MSYVFIYFALCHSALHTAKIVRADRENTRTLLLTEHEQSGHKKRFPVKQESPSLIC
ncbi:hypothetical protein AAAC51_09265 [Priestia megaterium]